MPEIYSPLRYPGGKAKLADVLIQVLKSIDLHEPDYIEPYAGGAGAALRLLFEEYVNEITINDADPRILSFWSAVTCHTDAFLELLEKVNVTVDEWRIQRQIYLDCNVRNTVRLGFATFFLNRTTRSGIIHNGGPIGGYDQTGKYSIDARFNRTALRDRVRRIGLYSDRIRVSGIDGLALLKKINRSRSQASRTFVYLDPPYYGKGADLYMDRFTERQHRELAVYLSTRKNFPWLMTYDNTRAIRRLYSRFPQVTFNIAYSAYERREGKELLIHPESVHLRPSARRALAEIAGGR